MLLAQTAGYTTHLTQPDTIYNPVLCVVSGMQF